MADNTRLKELQEGQRKNEAMIKEMKEYNDEKFTKLEQNMEKLSATLEAFMKLQLDRGKEKISLDESSHSKGERTNRGELYTPPHRNSYGGSILQNQNLQLPKIEFPEFDGEEPRAWIRRCNRFFQLFPMEEYAKVNFSSHYLRGRADLWFMEYVEGRLGITWELFCNMIIERFSEVGVGDAVIELSNLVQEEDVNSHLERFDELKAFVKNRNPGLGEEFFVSSFLSGLKPELRLEVQKFQPRSLIQAASLAKLEEHKLEMINRTGKLVGKNAGNLYNQPSSFSQNNALKPQQKVIAYPATSQKLLTYHPPPNKQADKGMFRTGNNLPLKKLTPAEYQARREKGLCYYCDEKYSSNHKCKPKQFNLIIAEEDENEDLEVEEGETESREEIEGEISLHALMGNRAKTTIK